MFVGWCTRRFSFTIADIINGIAGVADFILKPFFDAAEAILEKLGLPVDLPIPGLPSLDINLPSLDLPALKDIEFPSPFDELVPDDLSNLLAADLSYESVTTFLGNVFPDFKPICGAVPSSEPSSAPTQSSAPTPLA